MKPLKRNLSSGKREHPQTFSTQYRKIVLYYRAFSILNRNRPSTCITEVRYLSKFQSPLASKGQTKNKKKKTKMFRIFFFRSWACLICFALAMSWKFWRPSCKPYFSSTTLTLVVVSAALRHHTYHTGLLTALPTFFLVVLFDVPLARSKMTIAAAVNEIRPVHLSLLFYIRLSKGKQHQVSESCKERTQKPIHLACWSPHLPVTPNYVFVVLWFATPSPIGWILFVFAQRITSIVSIISFLHLPPSALEKMFGFPRIWWLQDTFVVCEVPSPIFDPRYYVGIQVRRWDGEVAVINRFPID